MDLSNISKITLIDADLKIKKCLMHLQSIFHMTAHFPNTLPKLPGRIQQGSIGYLKAALEG